MTRGDVEAFFLKGDKGRLFVLLRRSRKTNRCVIVIPPFAEELNKCRRQLTATAERLVEEGRSVIIPDLFGTGDSEGEFGDASWAGWLDDIEHTLAWAVDQSFEIDAVLAVRLGCILAAETAAKSKVQFLKSVFWQPVWNGHAYMTKFLRLRVAAVIASGLRESVTALREQLMSGNSLEVGGYMLNPVLYADIESADLEPLVTKQLGRLSILRTNRRKPGNGLSESATGEYPALPFSASVVADCLVGEPFWASSNVVVNQELCERTVEYIVQRDHEFR